LLRRDDPADGGLRAVSDQPRHAVLPAEQARLGGADAVRHRRHPVLVRPPARDGDEPQVITHEPTSRVGRDLEGASPHAAAPSIVSVYHPRTCLPPSRPSSARRAAIWSPPSAAWKRTSPRSSAASRAPFAWRSRRCSLAATCSSRTSPASARPPSPTP